MIDDILSVTIQLKLLRNWNTDSTSVRFLLVKAIYTLQVPFFLMISHQHVNMPRLRLLRGEDLNWITPTFESSSWNRTLPRLQARSRACLIRDDAALPDKSKAASSAGPYRLRTGDSLNLGAVDGGRLLPTCDLIAMTRREEHTYCAYVFTVVSDHWQVRRVNEQVFFVEGQMSSGLEEPHTYSLRPTTSWGRMQPTFSRRHEGFRRRLRTSHRFIAIAIYGQTCHE